MVGRMAPAFCCWRKYRSSDFNCRRAWFAALLSLSISFFFIPSLSHAQTASTVGQWSPVIKWPYEAIHAHVLPTGKVLFWTRGDYSQLWDPATNVVTAAQQSGANIFCSGHAFLPDGRLFVAGGHIQSYVGLPSACVYRASTNSWTKLPNMNNGRWYPSTTTLPNGDLLVIAGWIDTTTNNPLPQVWQSASGSWRNLTSAQLVLPFYPFMYVAPNGKVFMAGPNQLTRYLNVSGTGAWSSVGNSNYGTRNWGSSVMYDDGKVLLTGGTTCAFYQQCGVLPTRTAEIINLNSSTPTWQYTAPMALGRKLHNATLLPDGKVLVTGGEAGTSDPNNPNANSPAQTSEMWDPATGTWSTMASITTYRAYHAIALLLPDGRVLSAGGDRGGASAEIYSPPYLFKGARPTISSAPTNVAYGQSFFVGTPNATSISKVTLIGLSSVTHSFNMGQRINRPAFSQGSGGLNVTAPSNPNLALPGYYMLFVLNSTGVPSVAKILQLTNSNPAPTPSPRATPTPSPTPAAPSNLTATTASSSQINLAWTGNSGNETGFKIERSTNGTSFTEIARVGANSTTYTNTGLAAGRYYYRVRAYNSGGNSAYSNTAVVALGLPAAPTNLTASAVGHSGQVNLSWRDNSSNETGFQVERSTNGSTFGVIATTAANVTSYRDSSGDKRQRYYYRVCAKNKTGLSVYSNIAVKP